MTKIRITKHLKLPLKFDETKLKEDLNIVLEEKWIDHFNTRCYNGKWTSIPLYASGGKKDNIVALPSMDSEPVQETEFMKDCVYFREVLAQFECKLLSVRLLNLGAGANIKPHKDFNLGYENNCFRLHIPIVTNPKVTFLLDNVSLSMLPGECWYTNVNYTHSVSNDGDTDRIHLVIDGERNEWSDALFFSLVPKESLLSKKREKYSPTDVKRTIEELEISKPDGYQQIIKEFLDSLKME